MEYLPLKKKKNSTFPCSPERGEQHYFLTKYKYNNCNTPYDDTLDPTGRLILGVFFCLFVFPRLFSDSNLLQTRLGSNSQRSLCLCFPTVGNKGVHHHLIPGSNFWGIRVSWLFSLSDMPIKTNYCIRNCGDWRDGPAVKNNSNSCQGLEASSQDPHGSSKLPVTPVSGYLTASCDLRQPLSPCGAYALTGAQTHKVSFRNLQGQQGQRLLPPLIPALGGRSKQISELKGHLLYRVSSRTARSTQKACLEKK